MARDPKDLLQQVLGRITELPGADSLIDALNGMRERLDEMQKRVLGLDALEERVKALEQKLEQLSGGAGKQRPTSSKSGAGPKAPKEASPGAKRTASALGHSDDAGRENSGDA